MATPSPGLTESSLSICAAGRSTEYTSAILLLTQFPERNLNIFCWKMQPSTEDCISESLKLSRPCLFPGVTGRIWCESRAHNLCEALLSLIAAVNETIGDGGAHWGGLRSPTIDVVSQRRHSLTGREKATEPTDGSESLLLSNLAVTLITEHYSCTSGTDYFERGHF